MPFLKTVTTQTEIPDFQSLLGKSGRRELGRHSPTAHLALPVREKDREVQVGSGHRWVSSPPPPHSHSGSVLKSHCRPEKPYLSPSLSCSAQCSSRPPLTPRLSAALFAATAPKTRFLPGAGSSHSSSDISLVQGRECRSMAVDRHNLIITIVLLPFLSTHKTLAQSPSLFIPK